MPAVRTKHSVNGAMDGVFYETAAGTKMYLAHRTRKQIYQERWAWCIDQTTLLKCKALGITAIGVVWRQARFKLVHLTHVDDFFGEHSFMRFEGTRNRCLPMKRFRIDPLLRETLIQKVVTMR